jgi:hypothetical protein
VRCMAGHMSGSIFVLDHADTLTPEQFVIKLPGLVWEAFATIGETDLRP